MRKDHLIESLRRKRDHRVPYALEMMRRAMVCALDPEEYKQLTQGYQLWYIAFYGAPDVNPPQPLVSAGEQVEAPLVVELRKAKRRQRDRSKRDRLKTFGEDENDG
jgi:hypothetical protein